ncbi:MAG TPA: GNAT family N-acetyltransferase [Candidatus Paceibacterota bacterium]|nr:GNAT family N-acetyltransferase [Candidatus Paceibacterota bacterium]
MKTIPLPAKDFDIYIARSDTQWILREGEPLAEVYEQGYLPYSGAQDSKDIFYSGRSARVILADFELSSENRRIAKKFDGAFTREVIPFAEFKPDDYFWTLSLTYFAQKHGANAMPRARIEALFDAGILTSVIVYSNAEKIVAYVLEAEDGNMGHYWYSFYDITLAKQSLGMWLMLDCVRAAKERGLAYYYLGTVYGEKALYKTNFQPLEWWDGTGWNIDQKLLRERGRSE